MSYLINANSQSKTVILKDIKYKYVDGKAHVTGFDKKILHQKEWSAEIFSTVDFYDKKDISVTSIDETAFADCSSLVNIIIPDSVVSIGGSAFSNCSSLVNINVPRYILTIGIGAFAFCSKLKKIDVDTENPNYLSLDNILYTRDNETLVCFPGDLPEESFEIPNFVKNIGEGAFAGCNKIKKITIPSSVKNIEQAAFLLCTSLESVIIGENINKISAITFYGCVSLKKITIPSNITSIGFSAFAECKSLKYVEFEQKYSLPVFELDAFENNAPENIAIYYETVTLLNNDPKTYLKSVGFFETKAIPLDSKFAMRDTVVDPTAITIGNIIYAIGEDTNVYVKDYDKENIPKDWNAEILESVTLPSYKNPLPVTRIEQLAFNACTLLKSVKIPSSVITIGGYAFSSCNSLISVTFAEPSKIENINTGLFSDCGSLKNIIIPSSVTSIDNNAFICCTSLEKITIPSSVTSIGENAFTCCTSLEKITIPSSVTSIGEGAFGEHSGENGTSPGCTSLISVTFEEPSKIENINDGLFTGCESLKNITIPSSITKIGNKAFFQCGSLKNINIPFSVTSIGKDAFFLCSNLSNILVEQKNINFTSLNNVLYNKDKTRLICYPLGLQNESFIVPSSVTSIENGTFEQNDILKDVTITDSVTIIGEISFSGCSSLKSVSIGKNVKIIGKFAFEACLSLKNVIFKQTKFLPKFGKGAFNKITDSTATYYNSIKDKNPDKLLKRIGFSKTKVIKLPSNQPVDPVDPVAPVAPVDPVDPVTPVAPVDPVAPVTPVAPVDPVDPIDPVTPVAPVTPVTPVTPVDPVDTITIDNIIYALNKDNKDNKYASVIGYDAKNIPAKWNAKILQGVKFQDNDLCTTVKQINDSAFKNCSSLISVTISKNTCFPYDNLQKGYGTTFLKKIGDYSFAECTSLKNVSLTYGVNEIGNYAFSGCTSLKSIPLPNSMSSIGDYAFSGCTSLNIFNNVKPGLEGLVIGKHAFENCSYLKDIFVNSTNVGIGAFAGCTSLKSAMITFVSDYVFEGCSSLKSIEINTTIVGDYAFKDCSSLKSIKIRCARKIGKGVFNGSSLEKITIPFYVKYIDKEAFINSNISTIIVDERSVHFSSLNNVLYNCDKTTLICYPPGLDNESFTIPSSVSTIDDGAFYKNNHLKHVIIPDSVSKIGEGAFFECSALETVIIGKNVKIISNNAFSLCISLQKVTIPSKVESIGEFAFASCLSLKNVIFNQIKFLPKFGKEAFSNITDSTAIYYNSIKDKTPDKLLKSVGFSKTRAIRQ